MKDARTAAADEVDRVARGGEPARPARAPRSRKPEARETASTPAPPPASTGPDLRTELDAIAGALKDLQSKFGTQSQATVDQWAELEGRVRALEERAAVVPDVTPDEHIAVLTAQVTDLHQQVRELSALVRAQQQSDVRPSRQKVGHPRLNLG
jgi:hypothetical protein